MANTSEKTRRKLEEICRDERSAEKCVLTKFLNAEAKELTKDINMTIEILNGEIAEIVKQKDAAIDKRTQMLKNAKLYGVTSDTRFDKSWCALEDDHPSRVEFDAETNRQLKEILTMK